VPVIPAISEVVPVVPIPPVIPVITKITPVAPVAPSDFEWLRFVPRNAIVIERLGKNVDKSLASLKSFS
jgi:hypothetical protein